MYSVESTITKITGSFLKINARGYYSGHILYSAGSLLACVTADSSSPLGEIPLLSCPLGSQRDLFLALCYSHTCCFCVISLNPIASTLPVVDWLSTLSNPQYSPFIQPFTSDCLSSISAWMIHCYLKLSMSKSKPLFLKPFSFCLYALHNITSTLLKKRLALVPTFRPSLRCQSPSQHCKHVLVKNPGSCSGNLFLLFLSGLL